MSSTTIYRNNVHFVVECKMKIQKYTQLQSHSHSQTTFNRHVSTIYVKLDHFPLEKKNYEKVARPTTHPVDMVKCAICQRCKVSIDKSSMPEYMQ